MNALFFDVDGTLIDETTHQIPESAMEALRRTREKGNKVFINSGRTSGMLKSIMDMVDADGFLCGCGTELIYEGKLVYYYTLPVEMKAALQKASDPYGILVFLEGRSGWHCRPSEELLQLHPVLAKEYERLRTYVSRERGIDAVPYDADYEVSKFCIQADDGKISGHPSDIDGFRAAFAASFDIIDRGKGFYECVPLQHGKGTAVEHILQYLQLTKEDAYGFGDSSNDIEMFRAVGHPVAMGQHDDVLERFHPFITKRVEENGIYHAMAYFGLI